MTSYISEQDYRDKLYQYEASCCDIKDLQITRKISLKPVSIIQSSDSVKNTCEITSSKKDLTIKQRITLAIFFILIIACFCFFFIPCVI